MKKISLIALLVIFLCGCFVMFHSVRETSAAHVISHRGASGERIEHTFAAYDLAIQQGSKLIEQDLVTSKDGTLYVSHDSSAKRIAGVDKQYDSMTNHEIDQLRTANHETIHSLQSVFDRYKTSVTYVIELKSGASQVAAFTNIVRRNHIQRNVLVQSFDAAALKSIRAIFPFMDNIFLVDTQENLMKAVKYDYVDSVGINKSLMNDKTIRLIRSHHKKVNVWTVNSNKDIESAIHAGVDTYFTNYTERALELEKNNH